MPGEQPPPGKYIKLNTNENPYPPSPAVGRAIQSVVERGLQRYPDPLANPFRCRASQILHVPEDWIVCGNGSDDILTIVTRAFVGEGDLLRLPYPSYILYKTLGDIQGAKSQAVHFQKDWTLANDFCADAERLRLVFLPNPNSPSGTVLTPDQILEIAKQLPCPILIDEAYADFANLNCIDLVTRDERIMVSRSFSKSYALAGLRFGYLVAQPQIVQKLVAVKDSYNCDALSIAAATAAIDDQAWLVENSRLITLTRAQVLTQLRELGFKCPDSQANFVWAVHPRANHREIYEALKARQILVRYMQYPDWGDGLRISVGTPEQMAVFFDSLRKLV